MKYAYFDNQSTTTNIQSIPLDCGKLEIKSILRSSHIFLGIGGVCRSPAGLKESYLLRWHTRELATNSCICFIIPCQYMLVAKRLYEKKRIYFCRDILMPLPLMDNTDGQTGH